jgi:hypothetical protein
MSYPGVEKVTGVIKVRAVEKIMQRAQARVEFYVQFYTSFTSKLGVPEVQQSL